MTRGAKGSPHTFCFFFLCGFVLADAAFVASFNIPSPLDDDKVYFFFSETGEYDFFDKMKVSRVARVCKVRCSRKKGSLGIPACCLSF